MRQVMSILVKIEDDVPHLSPHTLRDVVEAIEDRFPQAKVKAKFDEGHDAGIADGQALERGEWT